MAGRRRAAVTAICCAVLSLLCAPAASASWRGCGEADEPYCGAAVTNGGMVAFSSYERLARGDRDREADVYRRYRGRTTLITRRTRDYAGLSNFAQGGGQIVFATRSRLSRGDRDRGSGSVDHYLWNDGRIRLLSTGPRDHRVRNEVNASNGISRSGGVFIFQHANPLTADDTDPDHEDVFGRFGEEVRLISDGPSHIDDDPFNHRYQALYENMTPDGRRIFFSTYERLVPRDRRDTPDIYEYRRGAAHLRVRLHPEDDPDHALAGFSDDGRRIFVATRRRLARRDRDRDPDLYEVRRRGRDVLLSIGPFSDSRRARRSCGSVGHPCLTNPINSSADGRRVFFLSAEPLVRRDRDRWTDIYMRRRGRTVLVSGKGRASLTPGDWIGMSEDGRHAAFTTTDRLLRSDRDRGNDVYEWSKGRLSLVSRVRGVQPNAIITGYAMSPNGRHIVFEVLNGRAKGVYIRSALPRRDSGRRIRIRRVSVKG